MVRVPADRGSLPLQRKPTPPVEMTICALLFPTP
jgi:hypothetical protein